ncbi:MAG: RusA family crossover junction endodeoxyribonuclease [Selenomonadaceae bacterium]|nr:RusA family crossover junction endodeoxyribonuclease [Selenomonadaceae bacterium]
MLCFEIHSDPIPLARPRFSRGRAYLSQRDRDYRALLQDAARRAGVTQPTADELICRLEFYRRFKPSARAFGDLDNHIKAVFDALQGLLFDDDKQIVSVTASKHTDKKNPRTVISFEVTSKRSLHD